MFLSTCFQRLLLANLSIFVLQRYGNKLGPIILHSTEAIVRGCSVKKMLLKISQHSQQKKPSVPEPQATTLLKKRLWHRRFPVNSSKCQRTLFFTEHLQWLLLVVNNHLGMSVINYYAYPNYAEKITYKSVWYE